MPDITAQNSRNWKGPWSKPRACALLTSRGAIRRKYQLPAHDPKKAVVRPAATFVFLLFAQSAVLAVNSGHYYPFQQSARRPAASGSGWVRMRHPLLHLLA
jgi:hypothetical protein